ERLWPRPQRAWYVWARASLEHGERVVGERAAAPHGGEHVVAPARDHPRRHAGSLGQAVACLGRGNRETYEHLVVEHLERRAIETARETLAQLVELSQDGERARAQLARAFQPGGG